MKRPLLFAFHLTMAGVYATIILAWQAGYIRLSISVWAAALAVCIAGLLICAAMLVMSGWPKAAPLPSRLLRGEDDSNPRLDLRGEDLDVAAVLSGISALD